MWWLIPIGAGLALRVLYNAISEDERNARNNWYRKRAEVERSIEEHRRNIEEHISKAQESYDYHFLTDLHYSSVRVADVAYKLLEDARKSISGMNKILMTAKEQREILKREIDSARINRDGARIGDLKGQLNLIYEMRKSVFDDRNAVKQQEVDFLSEVRRLNNQTKELKEYIRERCGARGKDWYERLEERRRVRRANEGR